MLVQVEGNNQVGMLIVPRGKVDRHLVTMLFVLTTRQIRGTLRHASIVTSILMVDWHLVSTERR